jgi:Fe-S cluster biogenesis protein NfuA
MNIQETCECLENHEIEPESSTWHKVEEVLDIIRPAMEADGGGVELVAIQNGIVSVRMKGTCLACPSVKMTLKQGIEQTLRQHFPWVTEVVRAC